MIECLKKLLILTQFVLPLILPFVIRVTPGEAQPASQLTPRTINLIAAQLRQANEDFNPQIDREMLSQEFREYCHENHLAINLNELRP